MRSGLQPRTVGAVMAAVMLTAMWLVSVEDVLMPEEGAPVQVVQPPAETLLAAPNEPAPQVPSLGGGSGSGEVAKLRATIKQLKAENEQLRDKVAVFEASDADTDAKKVVSLQLALADCKRASILQQAGNGGARPDEADRDIPHHDGRVEKIVETDAPPTPAPRKRTYPKKKTKKEEPKPTSEPRAESADDQQSAERETKGNADAGSDKAPVRRPMSPSSRVIPVVVFTYNRPERLRLMLSSVLKIMPERGFKLFVSQDGNGDQSVGSVVEAAMKKHPEHDIEHIVHKRDSSGMRQLDVERGWDAYYAIAHHYQGTINKVFGKSANYDRIVLVEDDLELAHDFFDYMQATAPLFDKDDSLYCVSGFNDNGKPENVADNTALYRSDFFPGLGWMTSRAIWEELNPIWPKGFWDDWMRQPDKRKGRSCVRPEVPRSRALCSDAGASGGQFCEQLERMRVSREYVDWSKEDVSYLLEPAYGKSFKKTVDAARTIRTVFEAETLPSKTTEVKILYGTNDELVALEQQLDIMTDFKDGVPRTAYHGTVSLRFKGRRLHLVAETELYVYS